MIKYLRFKKYQKLIKESGLFDYKYYLFTYPDVRFSDYDAIEHYLKFGSKEGRNPSSLFNTNYYLKMYKDVDKSNLNPLVHYILFGKSEKRECFQLNIEKKIKYQVNVSEKRRLNKNLTILFIDGESGSMSSFYQVEQVVKSLKKANINVTVLKDTSGLKIFDKYDLFILFRCRYTNIIENIVKFSKLHDRKIIYSCDDLLFSGRLKAKQFDIFKYLPDENKKNFEKLLIDSHKILKVSDIYIGPTNYLTDLAKEYTKEKLAYTIRNYPPSFLFETKFLKKKKDTFNLFYFSGSISHQKDFLTIEEVLSHNLEKYSNLQLHIVGKIDIHEFDKLQGYINKQVFIHPYIIPSEYYLKLVEYMELADVVLAPLDLSNEMVQGKSELKYFEAGIFGVPCIASASHTFLEVIENGKDGLLCSDDKQWNYAIEKLYNDSIYYKKISAEVKKNIYAKYSESSMNQNIIDTFVNIIDNYEELSKILKKRNRPTFLPALSSNKRNKRVVKLHKKILQFNLPTIDISVVTYYSTKWMDAFLTSLKDVSYPLEKINLYIIDHSESLSEFENLESSVAIYRKIFNKFVVKSQKNFGFGEGHNFNISQSSSNYILVINCDLEINKDTLNILVENALEDESSVASWEARQIPYEHPKYYDPITLETAWSSAACLLIRRAAFEKIGGFDEHFFMYCEDVELSFRFRDYGYKVKYNPKAVVSHFTYNENDPFKPLQAVGSFLGHSFIRLRYGTIEDIEYLKKLYKIRRRQFRGKIDFKSDLVKEHIQRFRKYNTHFSSTKKKSDIVFPFFENMHEVHRDGAFYKITKNNISQSVSIIVRVHGQNLLYLKESLACLINQTYKNIEIIVVEDKTNYSKEYCKKIVENGINLKYYISRGEGRNQSANLGLLKSTGEYIMFLDFDDLLFSDHIEISVAALVKNKKFDAAVSQSWMIYTKYMTNDYKETDYQVFNASKKKVIDHKLLLKENHIPIQAVLFKRKLYDKYKGIDESLIGFEDWELWLRYSKHAKFYVIPKTTSLFRVRDFSFHNVDKAERQSEAKKLLRNKYNIL